MLKTEGASGVSRDEQGGRGEERTSDELSESTAWCDVL